MRTTAESRALQQLTTDDGWLAVVANDQRQSLVSMRERAGLGASADELRGTCDRIPAAGRGAFSAAGDEDRRGVAALHVAAETRCLGERILEKRIDGRVDYILGVAAPGDERARVANRLGQDAQDRRVRIRRVWPDERCGHGAQRAVDRVHPRVLIGRSGIVRNDAAGDDPDARPPRFVVHCLQLALDRFGGAALIDVVHAGDDHG